MCHCGVNKKGVLSAILSLVSESPVPEDVECKESGGLLCPVEEEAVMSQKKQDIDSTQLQMLFLVLLRVDRYFLYNGGKSSPRYLPKVPLRWGVRRFSAWQPLSAGVVRPPWYRLVDSTGHQPLLGILVRLVSLSSPPTRLCWCSLSF